LGPDAVSIDGKSYPCRLHQYEITGMGQKSITRTHYSSDVAPYVLRRETTALETAGNTVTSSVLVEVKELNVPHTTCGEVHLAARLRVEQKHAKGKKETTEALSSLRVPGGVVWHDSLLVDANGVKLSHSTLELVDYHVAEPAPLRRDARAAHALPFLGLAENRCWSTCRESRPGLLTLGRLWHGGP
jgi:hypothetical protein